MRTVYRPYRHSSSFKMAALFAILLGSSILLLGYFLYDFGRQNFIRETEAAINSEIEHILTIAKQDNTLPIATYIKRRTSDHTIYFYQDNLGQTIAGNIDHMPTDVTRLQEGLIQFTHASKEKTMAYAAKIHTFSNGARILVARDIQHAIAASEKLTWISVIIIIFMLLVVIISFFISTFVVSRINRIANTAKHIIQTGDLSKRITVDSQWDDLSNLAQILNILLERVEQLIDGVRDISNSIAHDLRTPLTHLRNQLEEAKNLPSNKVNFNKLIQEADQMLNMFHALLRISKLEKTKGSIPFETIHINAIIHDVLELYEPLAEDQSIEIRTKLSKDILITGHADLLFQLMANLLDNAIKFSPKHSHITIRSYKRKDRRFVTIEDQGPGIDKNKHNKVFERFYCQEQSRSNTGSGLGLSMVKAIVDAHPCSISLTNTNPGLKITLSFTNMQN